MRYLPREDAPFSDGVWETIERTVLGTARSQLAGRKLLGITGPMGLGVRTLERGEQASPTEVKHGAATASLSARRAGLRSA